MHGRLARTAAALPRDQQRAARTRIGDRALGTERRQRFEDHIGELEIGRLIGTDRRRRASIGDRIGRVFEAHHLAHAVVEMQLRIERADQAIEHAGLDHRRPQIDRSPRLPVAVAEIEFDLAVLDPHRDRKAHRPLELDAVVVHEAFGRRFAVRQRLDGRAQFVGGAFQQRRERLHDRRRRRTARRFAGCARRPSASRPFAHACRRGPVRAGGCWRG